jgi:hypothetical protein
MTADVHVTEVPALVDDIEANIRSDAAKVMDDRAATLRWLAEEVADLRAVEFLASTHLFMVRPLCDEGLSDDDVAELFTELVEYTRSAQLINRRQHGDSTRTDSLIDGKVDLLLGRDTHITCVWCDRREDREIAETCDGNEFCSRDCHVSAHVGLCPEDKV